MKQIRYMLGTLILLLVVILNLSLTANAYTEEEKQQAKAWLSAHGYSPDMGGANQAYQDYLDGKFDEELGYDTNGDGIPASTTEEISQSSETETTKDNGGTTKSTGKQEPPTGKMPSDEAKTAEGDMEKDAEAEGGNTTSPTTESNQQAEDGKEEQTAETWSAKENAAKQKSGQQKDNRQSEKKNITWYIPEKIESYQDGLIVIILAVLVMVIAGIFFC